MALVLTFLADFKPDVITILGDGFDFYHLSSFQKDPRRLVTLQDEIDQWVTILKQISPLAPKKKYVEGNHEYRLRKFLNTRAPELSSLRALKVEQLFQLKELGIDYLPCSSPDKFIHNYLEVGKDLWAGHFDRINKFSAFTAKNLVEDYHQSIITGHTHRGGVYYSRDSKGFLIGVENYCLCDLNPNYIKNPNWQSGFSIIWKKVGDNRFQIQPINIVNYAFFYGEKEHRG